MSHFVRWCAGFFEARRTQSMTRLLALLCVLCAAAVVSITGIYVLYRPMPSAAVVAALLGVVAAFIGGGAVALVTRSKDTLVNEIPPSSSPIQ